jgi:hypothetical protein
VSSAYLREINIGIVRVLRITLDSFLRTTLDDILLIVCVWTRSITGVASVYSQKIAHRWLGKHIREIVVRDDSYLWIGVRFFLFNILGGATATGICISSVVADFIELVIDVDAKVIHTLGTLQGDRHLEHKKLLQRA